MRISRKAALMAVLLSLIVGLLGCGNDLHAPGAALGAVEAGEKPNRELKPEVREAEFDPQLEGEWLEKKQPLQGLFETTMEIVDAEEKLDIHFSLKNISGKHLQIAHGSGQQYDISVYNEQGEEVYRWSYNKAFTQALIQRKLKQGDQLDFEEEWRLADSNGEPVPAGNYTIEITVMIGLESGNISPDELTARSTVAIGVAAEL